MGWRLRPAGWSGESGSARGCGPGLRRSSGTQGALPRPARRLLGMILRAHAVGSGRGVPYAKGFRFGCSYGVAPTPRRSLPWSWCWWWLWGSPCSTSGWGAPSRYGPQRWNGPVGSPAPVHEHRRCRRRHRPPLRWRTARRALRGASWSSMSRARSGIPEFSGCHGGREWSMPCGLRAACCTGRTSVGSTGRGC